MIKSREEFFQLLLDGETLTKTEEVDHISYKYKLRYNQCLLMPFECTEESEGDILFTHEDTVFEEFCEWFFTESKKNYMEWGVLENE